jgi:putative aldouronate transport system substrate-binding protein
MAVITKSCKHPEIAARFLDYLWSEEGIMLANWGIKDKTYTINEKGEPHYTDFAMKNPDGWTLYEVKGGYMRSYASGPYAQDARTALETLTTPVQFEARALWSKSISIEHLLPPIRRTATEDEEFTTIWTDMRKMQEESILQFLLGNMSLDKYDTYVAQVKEMKIDRAIEIQQAAYDRYMAKKK